MSEESPAPNRHLRQEEVEFITAVARGMPAENKILSDLSGALVQDMYGGGIKFVGNGLTGKRFGRQIYHGAFSDADGVPVSVTITLDQNGDLFELDFFRADNSQLLRYPSIGDITAVLS